MVDRADLSTLEKAETMVDEVLETEKEDLEIEREALEIEKEALEIEREALETEKEVLAIEKEVTEIETEVMAEAQEEMTEDSLTDMEDMTDQEMIENPMNEALRGHLMIQIHPEKTAQRISTLFVMMI
jgi:hypothetical protein